MAKQEGAVAERPPATEPEPETVEAGDGKPAIRPGATIHERMVRILAELPAIGKTDWNEQQKFHFRSYDAVLNALNPLLGLYGVYVVPEVLERVTGERTTSRGNTMYEVNLHVRFRFYGLTGDYVEASAWGEGTDMGDKSTNKAATMALKYVLFQTFAISTSESVDADSQSPEPTSRGRGQQRGGGRAEPQPVQASAGPRNWQETRAWVDAYGDPDVWPAFVAFAQQALKVRYNADARAELSDEQARDYGARAAAAAVRVRDAVAPGEFPPPDRATMRAAWAAQLDVGQDLLEGPEWRMSPDETDRPLREVPAEPAAETDAEAASGSAAVTSDADAAALPFGDS